MVRKGGEHTGESTGQVPIVQGKVYSGDRAIGPAPDAGRAPGFGEPLSQPLKRSTPVGLTDGVGTVADSPFELTVKDTGSHEEQVAVDDSTGVVVISPEPAPKRATVSSTAIEPGTPARGGNGSGNAKHDSAEAKDSEKKEKTDLPEGSGHGEPPDDLPPVLEGADESDPRYEDARRNLHTFLEGLSSDSPKFEAVNAYVHFMLGVALDENLNEKISKGYEATDDDYDEIDGHVEIFISAKEKYHRNASSQIETEFKKTFNITSKQMLALYIQAAPEGDTPIIGNEFFNFEREISALQEMLKDLNRWKKQKDEGHTSNVVPEEKELVPLGNGEGQQPSRNLPDAGGDTGDEPRPPLEILEEQNVSLDILGQLNDTGVAGDYTNYLTGIFVIANSRHSNVDELHQAINELPTYSDYVARNFCNRQSDEENTLIRGALTDLPNARKLDGIANQYKEIGEQENIDDTDNVELIRELWFQAQGAAYGKKREDLLREEYIVTSETSSIEEDSGDQALASTPLTLVEAVRFIEPHEGTPQIDLEELGAVKEAFTRYVTEKLREHPTHKTALKKQELTVADETITFRVDADDSNYILIGFIKTTLNEKKSEDKKDNHHIIMQLVDTSKEPTFDLDGEFVYARETFEYHLNDDGVVVRRDYGNIAQKMQELIADNSKPSRGRIPYAFEEPMGSLFKLFALLDGETSDTISLEERKANNKMEAEMGINHLPIRLRELEGFMALADYSRPVTSAEMRVPDELRQPRNLTAVMDEFYVELDERIRIIKNRTKKMRQSESVPDSILLYPVGLISSAKTALAMEMEASKLSNTDIINRAIVAYAYNSAIFQSGNAHAFRDSFTRKILDLKNDTDSPSETPHLHDVINRYGLEISTRADKVESDAQTSGRILTVDGEAYVSSMRLQLAYQALAALELEREVSGKSTMRIVNDALLDYCRTTAIERSGNEQLFWDGKNESSCIPFRYT